MNDKTDAAELARRKCQILQRRNELVISPQGGSGLNFTLDPTTILQRSECSAEHLPSAIREAFAANDPGFEFDGNYEKVIAGRLAASGAKTWADYTRNARLCSVRQNGYVATVVPMVRERGGGFSGRSERYHETVLIEDLDDLLPVADVVLRTFEDWH